MPARPQGTVSVTQRRPLAQVPDTRMRPGTAAPSHACLQSQQMLLKLLSALVTVALRNPASFGILQGWPALPCSVSRRSAVELSPMQKDNVDAFGMVFERMALGEVFTVWLR